LAIILPRGFGKTLVTTKAAMLWIHLDDPDASTAIGSEVQPKAQAFLKPIKKVMQGQDPNAWFSWLYGLWYNPEREWSQDKVEHAYRQSVGISEPSFDTWGVDKGLTGYHPDVVVFDDPISANKLRQGGDSWLRAVQRAHDAIEPAVKTNGLYILVGTRYLVDDILGKALKDDGVKSWDGMPSQDTDLMSDIGKGTWRVYYMSGRDVANTTNFPEGEPTLPEVWFHAKMKRYEKRDPEGYASQVLNDPTTGEHMALTQEQVETMRIKCTPSCPAGCFPRQHLPLIEYATVHCDTAYKSPERRGKGDDNVIAVWLHPASRNGTVYFDGAKRDKTWRSEDFNDQLIYTLSDLKRRMIRVRVITADKNPGGQSGLWKTSVIQAIEGARLRVPDIQELNRSEGKTERIMVASNYWAEGHVKLVYDAPQRERLEYEMVRVGKLKSGIDLSDACADVFGSERPGQDWYHKAQTQSGFDPDEGAFPRQPGDEILKNWRGPLLDSDVDKLYDDQHPELAPPDERW
jgi:hypothetical protein